MPIAPRGGLIGIKPKIGGPAHGSLGHEPQGLAGVHGLNKGDFFSARLNGICNAVQDGSALCPRGFGPGGKGSFGGLAGCIYIGLGALCNGCQGAHVMGGVRLKCLPIASSDILTLNAMQDRSGGQRFQVGLEFL